MIENFIVVMIAILACIGAAYGGYGWHKAEQEYRKQIHALRAENLKLANDNARLKATNEFYKNQLNKQKNEVQKTMNDLVMDLLLTLNKHGKFEDIFLYPDGDYSTLTLKTKVGTFAISIRKKAEEENNG